MKVIRRSLIILRRTGTLKIFMGFVLFLCAAAVVLRFVEPDVHTVWDGIWFCFVSATTIGYGDIYAVTAVGRIVIICVTLYGILMTAMVPGVVVSYYMEYLKIQQSETISLFLEKLENLPQLSQEELAELSDKVKSYNKK